jgi:hypothetical protein
MSVQKLLRQPTSGFLSNRFGLEVRIVDLHEKAKILDALCDILLERDWKCQFKFYDNGNVNGWLTEVDVAKGCLVLDIPAPPDLGDYTYQVTEIDMSLIYAIDSKNRKFYQCFWNKDAGWLFKPCKWPEGWPHGNCTPEPLE